MRKALICAIFLAVTCGISAQASAAESVAGHLRLALETPPPFKNVQQSAQRQSTIVMQAWEIDRARSLKAANPNIRVLAYQNLTAMIRGTSTSGIRSTGVGYEEADSAHPDWFLLNTSGQRLTHASWNYLYMADPANAGYQQRWIENVQKTLAKGPWDGVMLDDTNLTAKYHTDASKIARYPTDRAYQQAVRSMLEYVYPRLKASGKLVYANIGAWVEYPAVAEQWLQYLDGGLEEMFLKWSTTKGEGYRDAGQWRVQLDQIATAQRLGKRFLAVTQASASDAQAIRYGWASTLLVGEGRVDYFAAENYRDDTWHADFDVDLGAATGAARSVSGGAWTRSFQRGLVVVNPSTSTVRVSFGGAYSGSGLQGATAASVAPKSALILTRDAAPEPEPRPEPEPTPEPNPTPEPTPEPEPTPTPNPTPEPTPNPTPTPEPEPTPEPNPTPTPEPTPTPTPEPNPTPTPEPNPTPTPTPEPTPEPTPQPNPTPKPKPSGRQQRRASKQPSRTAKQQRGNAKKARSAATRRVRVTRSARVVVRTANVAQCTATPRLGVTDGRRVLAKRTLRKRGSWVQTQVRLGRGAYELNVSAPGGSARCAKALRASIAVDVRGS
ncbi:putative glycoside hydrolase [Conexibacter arvalis]|uniref:Glycoside-hydrolase family GH114 TIM-barrel domain-containing protein n=1 Tax=Conexibacter arvalis TaxID=912552 RepID=A0A840IC72_9ACTN|nr:putative glycoside hydrolase [Conexibacter arvalis]MBB4661658.1 hypothetical protein [Conexibacter arvalis]